MGAKHKMKHTLTLLATLLLAPLAALHAEDASEPAVKKSEVRGAPFHFRPKDGYVGDTIPFYWQGQYHVFYLLKGRWEHTVSTDLIHWQELPTALFPTEDPFGPDVRCWTGSIVEHEGLFYLFYTGQNKGRDPINDQKVMLATSKDLIHWEKKPDFTFYPDGKIYWNRKLNGPTDVSTHDRAFRDPDVFWNEQEKQWWMLLHALDWDEKRGCTGLYTSPDLLSWTPRAPLIRGFTLDCPNIFPLGDHWFVIAGQSYFISAKNPSGPWPLKEDGTGPLIQPFNGPFSHVPKSLFDGRRRLVFGTIKGGVQDGTLGMAKELYSGSDGRQLFVRPAAEITAAFTETALDLSNHPSPVNPDGAWSYVGGKLCVSTDGSVRFNTPDDYMLQCTVLLDPAATLTVRLRQQADGAGFPLVVNPAQQTVTVPKGKEKRFTRTVALDSSLPVSIQAFVSGSIIELFINDRFAFSCREYDYSKGALGLEVAGGQMKISNLTVKTLPAPAAAVSLGMRTERLVNGEQETVRSEAIGGASQDAGKETSRLIRNLESGKPQTLVYYGTSLSGGHWSKQATKVLKSRYGNLITVHNRAKGGVDSKWGRENVGERVALLKPDAVTIEFSMNDAIANRGIPVEKARDNLLAMIDTLRRDNPDVELLLLTMNPLDGEAAARPANHPYYRGSLPEYYQMVRDVAASHGLRLIDLNKVWLEWMKKNPEEFPNLAPDGVHPQEAGCREIILPSFLEGLGLADLAPRG
jgi:beta-fructofuranosidase